MLRALPLVPASLAASVLTALGLASAAAQTPQRFAPPVIPLVGHPATGPDVKVNSGLLADLNGDQQADIVCTSFGEGGMTVFLTQDGQLSSTGTMYPAAKNPLHAGVADLDGDGDTDVLVPCYGDAVTGPQLWAYFNGGDGGFDSPPVVTNLGGTYSGMTVAALNGDAIPDVMLSLGSGVCVVRLGTGGGHFGPEIPEPEVFFPGLLVDDDADGDADMHYVDFGDWLVYRNDGAGHLQPAQNLGPQLSVSGVPSPGGTFSLHVDGMLGGAPVQLWVSPAPVIVPVGLGASLYVSPVGLISVPLALSGPPVPGFGQATLTVPLSPAVPPGLSVARGPAACFSSWRSRAGAGARTPREQRARPLPRTSHGRRHHEERTRTAGFSVERGALAGPRVRGARAGPPRGPCLRARARRAAARGHASRLRRHRRHAGAREPRHPAGRPAARRDRRQHRQPAAGAPRRGRVRRAGRDPRLGGEPALGHRGFRRRPGAGARGA
jgi:hypothetical protein